MTQQNRFSDEYLDALEKEIAKHENMYPYMVKAVRLITAQAKDANSLREQVKVLEEALLKIKTSRSCNPTSIFYATEALEKQSNMRKRD